MESEPTSRNPQTEKLFLWAAFILFCTVLAFTWSTYGDETARLAGLRANERQKEQAYAALERTRAQTDRYVDLSDAILNSSVTRPANAWASPSRVRL